MPTKDDQTLPSKEMLECFQRQMLLPKLFEFDAEGLKFEPLEIVCLKNGVEHVIKHSNPKIAICKAAFYKTIDTDRFIVKSSIRLVDKDAKSNVSGFNLKGTLKSGCTMVKSYTVIYNDPKFGRV